jgi:hypothetical protein
MNKFSSLLFSTIDFPRWQGISTLAIENLNQKHIRKQSLSNVKPEASYSWLWLGQKL